MASSDKTFRVLGMCCAEEVGLLKRELAPLVGGEQNLRFDLINAKLTVTGGSCAAQQLIATVGATGMTAQPWEQASAPESPWQRHGQAALCGLSGALLLLGFLLHVFQVRDIVSALASGGRDALPLHVVGLYAAAVVAGVWFVLPRALFAARRLRPDMNLLMTIAVLGAVIIGEWLEAATVSFLFALALLLEAWSVGRARRAISSLISLTPDTVRYVCPNDGDIMERPVEKVPAGAVVLVRPGERIPLDGVITEGATSINQAPITGESAPVSRGVGDRVFAGTINAEGSIRFRGEGGIKDTQLARIIRMVEEAQARRAPSEQWVDRFARIYTPAMLGLAALIALVPPLIQGGGWAHWFYQALVMLVIACPCALVISTPVSVVAGMASAARNGVLIKGGAFLEAPARLDAVALDKTGTLTLGEPTVCEVLPLEPFTSRELLALAAGLEAHSAHPLARAVCLHAEAEGVAQTTVDKVRDLPGRGTEGQVNGTACWIGGRRLLDGRAGHGGQGQEEMTRQEALGRTVIAVGKGVQVLGLISLADEVRPEAAETVRALGHRGVRRVVMLTGDNQQTAQAVASAVGIQEVRAGLLPGEKVDAVVEIAGESGRVAMVGDGVNDAPALAASSLGVAMGAMGSAAALETADVALMADDLSRLPWLIDHARRVLSVIKQNIFFALGLKAAFIILALAGAATLWMAIAADMGASLLVIFNGLRLLRPAPTGSNGTPAPRPKGSGVAP